MKFSPPVALFNAQLRAQAERKNGSRIHDCAVRSHDHTSDRDQRAFLPGDDELRRAQPTLRRNLPLKKDFHAPLHGRAKCEATSQTAGQRLGRVQQCCWSWLQAASILCATKEQHEVCAREREPSNTRQRDPNQPDPSQPEHGRPHPWRDESSTRRGPNRSTHDPNRPGMVFLWKLCRFVSEATAPWFFCRSLRFFFGSQWISLGKSTGIYWKSTGLFEKFLTVKWPLLGPMSFFLTGDGFRWTGTRAYTGVRWIVSA